MTDNRSRSIRTHEYRCEGCGLVLRGKLLSDGRIVPSNSVAASDVRLPCLCTRCAAGG